MSMSLVFFFLPSPPHPLSDITAGLMSSSRGGGKGERIVNSIIFKEPQLMFGEKEAGIIGLLGSVLPNVLDASLFR